MRALLASFTVLTFAFGSVSPAFGQKVQDRGRTAGPLSTKTQQVIISTEFGTAKATSDGTAALIEWQMKAERGTVGFDIYRIGSKGRVLVSEAPVAGASLIYGDQPALGLNYSYVDGSGSPGDIYQIEAFDLSGRRFLSSEFLAGRNDGLAITSDLASPKTNSMLADTQASLPKEVQYEIESGQLAPDLNTHRWVISQPGVRIGVKNEGLHRVTRAELESGGFNVNSDHTQWQLYFEGNQQSINVGPTGEYIEFFGRRIDTAETDTRVVYLINGQTAGKRMATRSRRPNNSTVVSPSYMQTYVLKERVNYTNAIRNGDAENFWGRVIASSGTTLNFNLTGVDLSQGNVSITVRLHGYSTAAHNVELILNNETIAPAVGSGQAPFAVTQQVPVSFLREGANTLRMTSTASGDTNLFDRIEISFARTYLAQSDRLNFYTQLNRSADLKGFTTPNVRIFDTTYENEPVEMVGYTAVPDASGFAVKVPAARGRLLYAAENGAAHQAVSISPFDTTLYGSPTMAAQLLTITHDNFRTQADQWSAYRAGQGTTVATVEVDEIYDEFSYGVMSADAVKAFLQYAHTNWQTPPSYVLLIGDATYDPRNYLGTGFAYFVPTKMINTLFSETASDEFLADFNSDGLAEIAVGRIPARTTDRVTLAFEKTQRWEAGLNNPVARGALFAFDLPNGYDFEGMSNRVRNELPGNVPALMIGVGQTGSQVNLLNGINDGRYIVNYSGHGSAGAWAGSFFFSTWNVTCTNGQTACVANTNNETIFTMLTCLNGFFIQPNMDSLAEALLFTNNGGAVASWASTGLTTPDVQEIMAKRFYNRLGGGTMPLLGDLIRDAKTQIPGGMDVRLSWTLIGDPMLKAR